MNIELKKDERIDDLEYKGLKIIQNKNGFCFGMDAILLSDFSKNIKKNSVVVDIGTGTGILSILLTGKTDLKKVYAIEVQEEVCDMVRRSILLNNLEKKIEVININVKEILSKIDKNTIDVVVTNPPYKKKNTGVINENEKKLISRHEIAASLEDFIKITKDLLKDKGEFYMVHKPDRLVDILSLMRIYKIEPKVIQFVCANKDKEPNLVLIKGVKNANPFLKIENNLYIYEKDGKYTKEILEIYNK